MKGMCLVLFIALMGTCTTTHVAYEIAPDFNSGAYAALSGQPDALGGLRKQQAQRKTLLTRIEKLAETSPVVADALGEARNACKEFRGALQYGCLIDPSSALPCWGDTWVKGLRVEWGNAVSRLETAATSSPGVIAQNPWISQEILKHRQAIKTTPIPAPLGTDPCGGL